MGSRIWFKFLGLFVLVLLTWQVSVSSAQDPAVVKIDPPALGLKPNEEGEISILVENVQNLYGLEFHIQFDPTVIEIGDADPTKVGVQLTPGDFLQDSFVAVNTADNTNGKIDYAVTLLNPAPPINGSGVIATMMVKPKEEGYSDLKITLAILASRDGVEIPSTWQGGAIQVSQSGKAPQGQPSQGGNQMTGEPALDVGSSPESPPQGKTPAPWIIALSCAAGVIFLLAVIALILVLRQRKKSP